LEKLIEKIYQLEKGNIRTGLSNKTIIGGVVPHAGYIFSAPQAVHFFKIVSLSQQKFDTIVIVNPSHTGYGEDISLCGHTAWDTPFGLIDVDTDFARETGLKTSALAHQQEHSGEVMLPLLKYFLSYDFKIIPITLRIQTPEKARQVAHAIDKAQKVSNKKILMIASSDFSHYVSPEHGKKQDDFVIDEILKLDTDEIYRQVRQQNVSCCGYGPIMSLIEFTKLSHQSPGIELLARGHSGQVMPSDEVVHYISMLMYGD
jgi:AmmeMemoRadiSam system protein B